MQNTAVVTGGTRGIGKGIARQLLNEGFRVFTSGSSASTVSELKSEFSFEVHSGQLIVHQVDASVKADVQTWAAEISAQVSALQILVNNAGRFVPGAIGEEPDGAFEQMIGTNLASAYHATRAFLPALKTAKGHIFNICSTASITAYTNGGSYCISKFGLLGMSKVLREELKPFKVKVTSILPGATLTDSWAGAGLPSTRFMQIEDVAQVLWNAYTLRESCVLEEIVMRPLEGDI